METADDAVNKAEAEALIPNFQVERILNQGLPCLPLFLATDPHRNE